MAAKADEAGRPADDERLRRAEDREWLDALDYVIRTRGGDRAVELLRTLIGRAAQFGVRVPHAVNTPYLNTIDRTEQPRFPGDRELERRIKSIIRWNAMAMVVRANRELDGIGGHISTYASAATLYEVGYNHFFRGADHPEAEDLVYFQGHASPGMYARAYVEGRLGEAELRDFRRELRSPGGLASYPHPRLMPDFWQFATVSMGLGPIMAIYQARFARYLEDRGLLDRSGRVWAFVGDGEMDEPESLGAISLAAREELDNLIFVVNCNLQRLDGPVRGNGNIIQELETLFRGAGWNVIKVVWGDDWDPLFAKDDEGVLLARLEELVDGDFQRFSASSGAEVREQLFGVDPRLEKMVEHLGDHDLERLRRGGHDPEKVYAAYKAATEHRGSPTVILAKTVKGYGMGEAGEGKNITHQQKKLNEEELRQFRGRFAIPISDEDVAEAPFYRPAEDSREMAYLLERREALGGFVPRRRGDRDEPLKGLPDEVVAELIEGNERPASGTMAFVRLLTKILKDPELGPRVVPIIPDEARTLGMDPLFRQVGIYSHVGQCYEPVDRGHLLYYREAEDGQILEEGITEAGCMGSFIAAGTSYSTYGVPMIPFFTFYSMFGFQRVGDLVWAACDMRARGFMIGGTAGRTSLPGEGLQHQDGHSQLFALAHPNVFAWDPAYAYEIAVIVRDGVRRMAVEREDVIYYLTLENEPYPMPAMPDGAEEGILRGMYRVREAPAAPRKSRRKGSRGRPLRAQLLASGAILNEALAAQEILAEAGVAADVWSVTSFKALLADALEVERGNRLHPERREAEPYVAEALADGGVVVAASDWVKAVPQTLARWVPGRYACLGTDGFGRSDGREALRDFFEVDRRHIAAAALAELARDGLIAGRTAARHIDELGIDPDSAPPERRDP
ncbi:MAG TPA: pyruvate dehydrogenase (acetyl-transferring), homodimeric type [Candidatus Sulfomarinibacteraceae bacterium]|nr:pyruvate dehydrogenase (acetyl-transferring), homodimeric type [Candidatus Sulfomarinibacteraceae bacterium]